MKLTYAFALLLWLTVPAEAATFFADDNGAGTTCSSGAPCSLATLIGTLQAGDTGIVNPGTYSGGFTLDTNDADGTLANPITLRAANPAVSCANPDTAPDDCTYNTTGLSIFESGSFRIGNGTNGPDHWTIEGFRFQNARPSCLGSGVDGPDRTRLRFSDVVSTSTGGGMLWQYCYNSVIEHNVVRRQEAAASDYGLAMYYVRGVTVRNHYCAGNFNHCISLKRGNANITIERMVCEGAASECIHLGQNLDDQNAYVSPTLCTGRPRDDGSNGNVYDHTAVNVVIRNVFARPATGYVLRFPLRLGDVNTANIQNVFGAPNAPDGTSTGFFHTIAPSDNHEEGVCGVEAGNNTVRGMIIVATAADVSCLRIQGNGQTPGTLTLDNVVCHDPDGGADAAMALTSGVDNSTGAFESAAIPTTTYRNYVHNDCSTSFSGSTATVTQQTGAVFNCGTAPGGALNADPSFAGPETVPIATLSFVNGRRLWDWAGVYQPIINRFATTRSTYVNAGTGTAAPCTGTCDIGANEFFIAVPPAAVWQSCAVYQNNVQVFGSFANPWIAGRGLVIDVDCTAKQFVIGRCNNPLDAATCDTDVYIYKAASQVRKRRLNVPVTLTSGTATSAADTSGLCWRTRATLNFSEDLEEVTGIWVRFEVDPNGGTHTCSAVSPPTFAWQGAE